MTQVTKKSSMFEIMSPSKTLREMKDAVDEISITTKDQAVDFINMKALMDYASKILKPQAEEHLNNCIECEEHMSRSSGLSVVKVRRGNKVWNTTPEIQSCEKEIADLKAELAKANKRLKFLQEMAGYTETDNHYWKAKV
jgi:hypothetical protein